MARSSERALILAPLGRDAAVAMAMLAEAGIESSACSGVSALAEAFVEGAGFVLVTEEALATADLHPLAAHIAAQEEWSDLPFILLTTRGGGLERNPSAARFLSLLGNVTFLERPFHPTTLVSLAQAALRGRRRQYEARARLKELHDGRERYRTLFESIDAGFCIVEVLFEENRPVDYRFIEVNPAFLRQSGFEDAVGRRIREVAPDVQNHWIEAFGAVAATGRAARFENTGLTPDSWYDVYAFRVGAPDERRVAILFNDISARRNVEEALRDLTTSLEHRVRAATTERETALAQLHEAQKLETLGQLTGGVAHDFNNLLTPITGALDLLKRRFGSLDASSGRLIDNAIEAAERARILVQRLLGFARRQALNTRPTDLGGLLDGVRDLVAASVGPTIELKVEWEVGLPPALVDPNQLELAILNLCVNARDAMPTGGVLRIEAMAAASTAGETPPAPPGRYVRLSVIDSGVGMDETTLAHAVEPFYSTKELGKGTGLGLSMVHGLASQLGGGFRLTSAPGAGTRVDLWLPVAPGDAPARRAPPPDALASGGASRRVLLVDDEALVRSATAEMLRDMGHTVVEADGGTDALEKLEHVAVDLVITDFKMPRMTGAELARRLRSTHPELPILLITGYSGSAEDAGDLPRLDKPFRRGELALAVEGACASARAEERQGA